MESLSVTNSQFPKHHLQDASNIRIALMKHLSNFKRRGEPFEYLFPKSLRSLSVAQKKSHLIYISGLAWNEVPGAQIVLWDQSLKSEAYGRAEQVSQTLVTEAIIPRVSELWLPYGHQGQPPFFPVDDNSAYVGICDLLIPTPRDDPDYLQGVCLVQITFCFLSQNKTINLAEPPKMLFNGTLKLGQRPEGYGKELFSCLSFRASPIVAEKKIDDVMSRQERRRLEREGLSQPEICMVYLRPLEAKETSRDNAELNASRQREYNHRFPVQEHMRRYHAGTEKEFHTIVRSYIKGPEGKPIKCPPKKVVAVIR